MEFEWDVEKYEINLERHKMRFEFAAKVFLDPLHMTVIDDRFDYGEERYLTAGYVDEILCIVVWTESKTSKAIRIISARKATKQERRRHDNG